MSGATRTDRSSQRRSHGARLDEPPDRPASSPTGFEDHGPGDRARQVDVLIDGTPTPLHNLIHGTHHTVLLFTGADNRAPSTVELCRIAERLE